MYTITTRPDGMEVRVVSTGDTLGRGLSYFEARKRATQHAYRNNPNAATCMVYVDGRAKCFTVGPEPVRIPAGMALSADPA